MSKKNTSILLRTLWVVALILIGAVSVRVADYYQGPRVVKVAQNNKIDLLLSLVKRQYVDTVNMHEIIEEAMPAILSELDPHSSYIPAEDNQDATDQLEGSFFGIGVMFSIHKDTVHINDVVKGGPSEKVGLRAGDRIVGVDDSTFVGKKVTNHLVMRKLKGPKDSKVKLDIKRTGAEEILHFTVTRDRISQNSIETAYMIRPGIGYIQIDRFARTTPMEMISAIAQLNHDGCKGLIIDLRSNGGGYMSSAIQMVNEFLERGDLIVYSQGRAYPRMEEFADGTGSSKQTPIVVLIDEQSASASEIFSGAIQDNDRGVIIGRRSFGKGLVQQPISFSDNSTVRLTVARYYTPSGRCIQRPYTNGRDKEYKYDWFNRFEHGELYHKDSIHLDSSKVYTTSHLARKVYGGGGIMPDIFVPRDTTGTSSYLTDVLVRGLIRQYTFDYSDAHRITLEKHKDLKSMIEYLNTQNLVSKFIPFATKKGIKARTRLINKSYSLLRMNIYGGIIYNVLGRQPYVTFINQTDNTVKKAIEVLEEGKANPQTNSIQSK